MTTKTLWLVVLFAIVLVGAGAVAVVATLREPAPLPLKHIDPASIKVDKTKQTAGPSGMKSD